MVNDGTLDKMEDWKVASSSASSSTQSITELINADDDIVDDELWECESPVLTSVQEVCFISGAPCLTSNLEVQEEWNIRIVNNERWRIRPSFDTLDFQLASPEIDESYRRLAEELTFFYEDFGNAEKFHLSVEIISDRKIELAVVKTSDGEYKRVQIIHLLDNDEEWEDFSDSDDETLQGTGTEEEPSKVFRVIDADDNVDLHYRNYQWFYLVDRFSRLPFRTRELGLTDTEAFLHLFEYKDVAYEILRQIEVFNCSVDYINENNIPFVTLKHHNWETTVNMEISVNTVKALPVPSLPPVGEAYDGATISHGEINGEMFLQFKCSPTFELFHNIEGDLTERDYLEAKEKGPYSLSWETVYLAPYDGFYYRCKRSVQTIHEDCPEFIDIYFIDYGNYSLVDKLDLVPCQVVDPVFSAFPRMAVRAHLRNISEVNWNVAGTSLPEKVAYVVETLTPQTATEVAYIELMRSQKGTLLMLSESLVKSKCAEEWSDKLLGIPTSYPMLFAQEQLHPATIPMGEMNWSLSDTKLVIAEPGAILEVLICGKYDSDNLLAATPADAFRRLRNLRSEIDNWYMWNYIRKLTEEQYNLFRWRSFEMGHTVLVTNYENVRFFRRSGGSILQRGRILAYNPITDEFKLLNVDAANIVYLKGDLLHPLGSEFHTLPAQAALLSIDGLEGKQRRIVDNSLVGKRFLVKVEVVTYENDAGRCIIRGNLFPLRTEIPNSGSETAKASGSSQSIPASEANTIDLGKPLGLKDFPLLGSYMEQ